MPHEDEISLATWGAGSHESNASMRHDTVLKVAGPWSDAVIALLRHFEAVGFDAAPRVMGSGYAPDGRMTLTYVPGTSAHPRAWPGDGAAAVGALLRRAHDASASFRTPIGSVWAGTWLGDVGAPDDVIIGHRDAAPWNIVGPMARPSALIDWDQAGPVPRLTEVAYAAWLNAQLHDDDIAMMHDLPNPTERARQARDIADGYGLVREQRQALVDRMIEVALASVQADADEHRITPESTEAVSASGYPVLWSITWRARSAAWMVRHRRELSKALGR